jgi:CubicO group peptidase (beta-lactamase class C family)
MLATLTRNDLLQQRLEACCPMLEEQHIGVALHCEGRDGFAAIGVSPPASHSVFPGCVTKLFTAALLRTVAQEQGFSLDWPISAVLENDAIRYSPALKGVQLRHLIDHCHGLDGSAIDRPPWRPDGFIDGAALVAQLEAPPRLAPPGSVCSYSEAGAWLAALVVERTSGKRFIELLPRVITTFDATAPTEAHEQHRGICPAMGGTLTMPISMLMAFLANTLQPGAASLGTGEDPTDVESRVRRRAGWSAVDLGVYFGWAYYGHGWFGHNSVVPRAPLMVRLNPWRRLALAVSTNGTNPTLAAARLLGRMLPELFPVNTPGSLDDAVRQDLSTFEGCYATQRVAFELRVRDEHDVELNAFERTHGNTAREPFAAAVLRPGRDNILIAKRPHRRLPRFFQLISPRGGEFHYLWDGEAVFPRVRGL